MAVRVITDSTSNVFGSDRAELGIGVVQMTVTYGGVTRDEDDVDPTDLYRHMRETGEFQTSSQPSVAAMVEALERLVAAGDEVVGVFVSSDMSGTVSTALMARDQILERRPEARIAVVEARSNSMEEGFAALAAGRAANGATASASAPSASSTRPARN